jgi:hypothetical protein
MSGEILADLVIVLSGGLAVMFADPQTRLIGQMPRFRNGSFAEDGSSIYTVVVRWSDLKLLHL